MGVAPVPATNPILIVVTPAAPGAAVVGGSGAAAMVGACAALVGAAPGADVGGALVEEAQPSTNESSPTRTRMDRPPLLCITLECREWHALNRSRSAPRSPGISD